MIRYEKNIIPELFFLFLNTILDLVDVQNVFDCESFNFIYFSFAVLFNSNSLQFYVQSFLDQTSFLSNLILFRWCLRPKKVMQAMKKGLGKPAMKSGLGKPAMKSALGKAVMKSSLGKEKEKQKTQHEKNKLNRANLGKLGQMSLEDKIKAAAETGGSEEDQAIALKDSLTKEEHAKVWGRHQTHLNKNPLEKEEMEGLSKKEKEVKAAEWLMKTAGRKYLHVSREVLAKESLEKDNTWKSEKQMMDQFGADELWAHCASGRVVYRMDPHTRDVWQYKDTQAWKGSLTVGRSSKWQEGHEMEPGEEEGQQFDQLYYQEAMGLDPADDLSGSFGKGKGFGKGSGKGSRKGKGSGKGNNQLAIKDKEDDEEEDEDELMKEALEKARRARDQIASVQNDLEKALGKASSRLSQKGKAGAQGWVTSLSKELVQLKAILNGKKQIKPLALKKLLEETAKLVKGAKDETKELKQLANKEASVAGSKKSRN